MRGLDNAQINWRNFFQGQKICSAQNTLNIVRWSFVVTLRASYYHPGTRTACPKTSRNTGRRRKPTLGCWIQQCFGHWGTKNSRAAATSKVKILTLPPWLVWTANIFQVQILLLWLPSKERAHWQHHKSNKISLTVNIVLFFPEKMKWFKTGFMTVKRFDPKETLWHETASV